MKSGVKNAFAIALGIGLGLLALATLSGAFTTATSNSASFQSATVPAGSFSPAEAQPRMQIAIQNQTLAAISNPWQSPLTVAALAGVSLVAALAVSFGMSRKMNSLATSVRND